MSKDVDPFLADPLAPLFVEASFQAHDESGKWRIPDNRRRELMASFCLSAGQTAAYAYLAEHRAEEFAFEADIESLKGTV